MFDLNWKPTVCDDKQPIYKLSQYCVHSYVWAMLLNITPSHFPIDTMMKNTLKTCIMFWWNMWYHEDSCGGIKHWCGIKIWKWLLSIRCIEIWIKLIKIQNELIINEQVIIYGERVLHKYYLTKKGHGTKWYSEANYREVISHLLIIIN